MHFLNKVSKNVESLYILFIIESAQKNFRDHFPKFSKKNTAFYGFYVHIGRGPFYDEPFITQYEEIQRFRPIPKQLIIKKKSNYTKDFDFKQKLL